MKNSIFTTDLHLTEQPRDSHRFGVFPLLKTLVKERQISYCFILGDLMDKTDRHPSGLVNRVVEEIGELAENCNVIILKGNHDYVDPTTPFFKFLNRLSNVRYVVEPTKLNLDNTKLWLLPHTREPQTDWRGLNLAAADILMIHQTVKGAHAENDMEMEGASMDLFNGCKEIYSGDVHVPQSMGTLTYVGSPYHVHYGDRFKPRILFRESTGRREDYFTSFPAKHVLDIHDMADLQWKNLRKGDHSNVFVHLRPEQWKDWAAIKKQVKDELQAKGIEIHGMEMVSEGANAQKASSTAFLLGQQSPHLVLDRFMQQKYPDMSKIFLDSGHQMIKDVDNI